jgi:hypothetical protein
MQPQVPPTRQLLPAVPAVQSVQLPLAPHAAGSIPVAH